MKLFFSAFVLAGVSGLVFACSGSTVSTSSGSASAADAESFISQFCAVFEPCCGKIGKPTDGAICRQTATASTAKLQYNPQQGSTCLADLKARSSTSTFCDAPLSTAACDGAFGGPAGTKAPGEVCKDSDECAASTEGTVSCSFGASDKRACQVELEGAAGSTPCVATRVGDAKVGTGSSTSSDGGASQTPSRGYVCDVAKGIFCGESGACETIQEVGGACPQLGNIGCVKSAFCNGQTSKCEARGAIGASCRSSLEACADGAHCDQTSRVCVANLGPGAPCKSSLECSSNRCSNDTCGPSSAEESINQLCSGK